MPVLILYSIVNEKQASDMTGVANHKTFNTIFIYKVLAKFLEEKEVESYAKTIFKECKKKKTMVSNPVALFYLTAKEAEVFKKKLIYLILKQCSKIPSTTKRYTKINTAENKHAYKAFASGDYDSLRGFSIVRYEKEMKAVNLNRLDSNESCISAGSDSPWRQTMELNKLTITFYSAINSVVRKYIKSELVNSWTKTNFNKMREVDKKLASILKPCKHGFYELR